MPFLEKKYAALGTKRHCRPAKNGFLNVLMTEGRRCYSHRHKAPNITSIIISQPPEGCTLEKPPSTSHNHSLKKKKKKFPPITIVALLLQNFPQASSQSQSPKKKTNQPNRKTPPMGHIISPCLSLSPNLFSTVSEYLERFL